MIHRRMPAVLRAMPEFVQRHVLHFEASIEDAVRAFTTTVPRNARVLDAGAGEAQYAALFDGFRYTAVDLGVGDAGWSYESLDALADLARLPFADAVFDAAVNIVTLEHVREPGTVLQELARVLKPGGVLLLVTPLEWEEHQQPHDYYRYTRYGITWLLENAGLTIHTLEPVGGMFRLLARRLFGASMLVPVLLPFFAPLALALPALDRLDRSRHFTLGHICVARKPSS
jgi:SAM-dependent methyltransferase